MYQLVESIRIENGRVRLIDWHNARCNRSMKDLWGVEKRINLRQYISLDKSHQTGSFKCRIIYGEFGVEKVEIDPYATRKISSIKMVNGHHIQYAHKRLFRPELDALYSQKKECDEICIVDSQGMITDAYYFNFVFESGGSFFTPSNCLLPGVMRSYLLHTGKITSMPINEKDLAHFDKVYLINALNPLGSIIMQISDIHD